MRDYPTLHKRHETIQPYIKDMRDYLTYIKDMRDYPTLHKRHERLSNLT